MIFIGDKWIVIDKRRFSNGDDSFANHNAFAFGVIYNKRVTTAKAFKEYVLPSLRAAIVQMNKLVFSILKFDNFKRIVSVHLVFVSCNNPK